MITKSDFKPLHPLRLLHPLEGTLRKEWDSYIAHLPGFDLLAGPEVRYADLPKGVESEENILTGGYQPFPYGRMTDRDKMVAAELIQWLGSQVGFAFLATAFQRAGGSVTFDDFKNHPDFQERKPNINP